MNFEIKDNYDFSDLISIMKCLRAEDGCPWDREQTSKTIMRNMVEEAYEFLYAAENDDLEEMREELGDVLLQVVFHSQINSEAGNFDINAVCDIVCKKLVSRHPHIFGNVDAKTSDEVLKNWDSIKMQEKGISRRSDFAKSASKSLPALMRAQKIQEKALKAGYEVPDVDNITHIAEKLTTAARSGDKAAVTELSAKMMFAVSSLCRENFVEAEFALNQKCDEFVSDIAEKERNA